MLTGSTASSCTPRTQINFPRWQQHRCLTGRLRVCAVQGDSSSVQLLQQQPGQPSNVSSQQQQQQQQQYPAGDQEQLPQLDTQTTSAGAGRGAGRVLRTLCHYAPLELADGPASLSKVRPYNAAEVQQALVHARPLLQKLTLQQMSNIAGALSAAGHLDHEFMQQLGDAAAARLRAVPRVMQPTQGLRAFRVVCWLAVGFSRLGVLHVGLMEQLAVYATHLLQRCPLRFSKRRHGHQFALLAAAFAAVKLYPPQLLRALGEHLKQHRQVVKLLGAQESMLLLWALARVGHRDPPAQLALTQRATTQVGQLTCQGLAHAYTQCAAVGLNAAPLLAALRKAVRVKLSSMQPADLTAILTALAALGQQDLLYLDEASRAVYNKLNNFTAGEVSATLAALAALQYRNPWLLERVSSVLCNAKLRKAYQLTPEQLSQLLSACLQLGFDEPLLLGHLGSVAVEVQLPGCSPAQLAAVLQGYSSLRFQQPELLQAAATRLLQLVLEASSAAVAATAPQQQQLQHAGGTSSSSTAAASMPPSSDQQLPHLVAAAVSITSMPTAAGSSAEKAVLPAALLGLACLASGAAEGLLQGSSGLPALASAAGGSAGDRISDSVSDKGSSSGGGGSSDVRASVGVQGVCSLPQLLQLLTAVNLYLQSHFSPPAAAASAHQGNSRQQDSRLRLSELAQGLTAVQAQLQQGVSRQLEADEVAAATAADAGAGVKQLMQCPALLQCMQLLWLVEQTQATAAPAAAAAGPGAVTSAGPSTPSWRLGLSELSVDTLVQQQLEVDQMQLQQQQALKAAVARVLQRPGSQQQGAADMQVQLRHVILGSPVVVPIVAGLRQPDGASTATDRKQPGAFLHVAASLGERKLQLPDAAQAFIADSQQTQRPLGVLVEGDHLQPALYTCNAPHQMLPAAEVWVKGLQAAGWNVLVLQQDWECPVLPVTPPP